MSNDGHRRVAWFSCGAASAVAAKMTLAAHPDSVVVYCDTMQDEHPDNRRFFDDVERWLGVKIERLTSTKYATVDDVFEKRRYMSGVAGAICTTEMKKLPRERFQRPDDIHVFGYTAEERDRAEAFEERNASLHVEWPLINGWVTKAACLDTLQAAGIALPAMYGLGFDHNNCLGCVKSSSPGYWNHIRRLFPEVFDRRALQSRSIGARLVKIRLPGDPLLNEKGKPFTPRHFLDELPADADAPHDAIECGPVCQMELPL